MRGCQPKKYLEAAAEVVELAHQMWTIGIHPVAGIDWAALMRSETAFTSAVPGRTEHDFLEAGIEMLHARHISYRRLRLWSTATRSCELNIA
jgi:glutathione reductase (NADPH)